MKDNMKDNIYYRGVNGYLYSFTEEPSSDMKKKLKLVSGPFTHEEIKLFPEYISPFERLRTLKLLELARSYKDAICGGFLANIIGHNVHYRSNSFDQMRFKQARDSINGAIIWEGESATHHTQSQGQSLCNYFDLHMNDNTIKYASLFQQAKSATTEEELKSIVWGKEELVTYGN